jgi:type VI protein secretion system component Hcp
MIDQETKRKLFEAWHLDPNREWPAMSINATQEEFQAQMHRHTFNAALDLILPLLERSLEANRSIRDFGFATCEGDGEQIYNIADTAIATIESELKQLGGKE